jgi:hypothetical protein
VRLDDNETRISGARRGDVTGPHVEELALPKSLKGGNFNTRQGCHQVDIR